MFRIKFYKIRAIVFVVIVKLLSKILAVKIPPILSVAGFIEKDGKMLFLDLSYMKGFGLPGGIVGDDEDVETALEREIAEETGLSVTNKKYLWSISYIKHGVPSMLLMYVVQTSGQQHGSIEGKLLWRDPSEVVGKMAYKNCEAAIRRYLDEKGRTMV